MNSIMQQMAIKKIKQISKKELLTYSEEYEIPITPSQADQILHYIKTKEINPFTEQGRLLMFKNIARITDISTAQQAQKLFHELIKTYGIESWFS